MNTNSESDSDTDEPEEFSTTLRLEIEDFLAMAPNNHETDLKTKLQSSRSTNVRSSSRIDDRKKLEDILKDLSSDFVNFQRKFDNALDCIAELLNRVESLEDRVANLEKKTDVVKPQPSYAQVFQNSSMEGSKRINRLEYISSENERKNRVLQIQITHPTINSSCENLAEHMKEFFSAKLKLPAREIDANFVARKGSRDNTAIVTMSDRRFKLFIYKSRRKLKLEEDSVCEELYINDNLTSLNYSLLKKLKEERNRLRSASLPVYDCIYTIDGRIYVKLKSSDANDCSKLIKSEEDIHKLLNGLNQDSN